MATYTFETITAQEALSWTGADRISVAAGKAVETTVIYNADGSFAVTIGGRTVTFGAAFSQGPAPTVLTYPDASRLWIGRSGSETFGLPGHYAGVYGGAGADTIQSQIGEYLIQGNQGDDRIILNSGSNTIYGGQDNDYILVGGQAIDTVHTFMQGNKGEDTIIGSANSETILGGQGNDNLTGSGGLDTLNGNLGDDTIFGSGLVAGEGGNDTITIHANRLSTVFGGDGDDRIAFDSPPGPRAAGAVVNGDAGNDILLASNGADTLNGGTGNDTLTSGPGNIATGDVLDGGPGDDMISARDGSNLIQGGDGNDRIVGGDGADTIDGGGGADTLSGDTGPGSGADVFVLDDPYLTLSSAGLDRITDWQGSDRLRLTLVPGATAYQEFGAADFQTAVQGAQNAFAGGTVEVVAVLVGSDVVVFFDGSAHNTIGTGVILVGRNLSDISIDKFA